MTLNISLSPKSEAKLKERAAATGEPVEAVASRMLEQAVEQSNGAAAVPGPSLSRAEAERRLANLREWATMREPSSGHVDDSRDSIYEGRGE